MFKIYENGQLSVCGGIMEIKNDKFKTLFKRYGLLSIACVFSVVVALAVTLSLVKNTDSEPVSTGGIKFGLPMSNAVVVKDYADDRLQLNESLKRWEIHLAIDMTSENQEVFSVADGLVSSVESNSLDGYVVTIEHTDGFVSVYSSLSDNVKVKKGDKVNLGQQIGIASTTATNESLSGGHLHFSLLKDGVEVDPNIYLDLQNK